MSKRRIDPETGEPALTWRENRMVDEFVSNGGNPARAQRDKKSSKRFSTSDPNSPGTFTCSPNRRPILNE